MVPFLTFSDFIKWRKQLVDFMNAKFSRIFYKLQFLPTSRIFACVYFNAQLDY